MGRKGTSAGVGNGEPKRRPDIERQTAAYPALHLQRNRLSKAQQIDERKGQNRSKTQHQTILPEKAQINQQRAAGKRAEQHQHSRGRGVAHSDS